MARLVRMSSSLPEGTDITIKVGAGSRVFEATGKVIRSEPNRSIGVAFQCVEPRYAAVLEAWLSEARNLNALEETA